jgi:hypothetical protein
VSAYRRWQSAHGASDPLPHATPSVVRVAFGDDDVRTWKLA